MEFYTLCLVLLIIYKFFSPDEIYKVRERNSMASQKIVDVDENLSPHKAFLMGLQHFLCMVGGAVLVPLLVGFNPSISILTSGIGTIIYLLITRNRIPSYLGGSFVFISPLIALVASEGVSAALSGVIACGLIIVIVAYIIRYTGTKWIDRILPPVVVASILIVIGLGLSSNAVTMAMYGGGTTFSSQSLIVATITLSAAVFFSSLPGAISAMSILLAMIVGYIVAMTMGMVDFEPVRQAAWFGFPEFVAPQFNMKAVLLIGPLAFIVIIENIGHLLAVGEVVNKDYREDIFNSLAGDGFATICAGLLGSAPATTYAQNIGVLSITKVYATQIFWYAAGVALVVGGCMPKVEFLIESIPTPVMGGVLLLLFGLVASNGLLMLVSKKIDFNKNRNLMIVSITLVLGIGMECAGIVLPLGEYAIPGMALSSLVGIILNLLIPMDQEAHAEELVDL